MSFPKFYRPLAPSDLIRIGSDGDGGYVLPERILRNAKALLSMGLCDDWSFEQEFSERSGVPFVVFDHSVNTRFWIRRFIGHTYHGILRMDVSRLRRAWRFLSYLYYFDGVQRRHVQRAIGCSSHGCVDLEEALLISDFKENIFLKIDIEGNEYRILDQLVSCKQKICGIAMELHDIDLHEERIRRFLEMLRSDFVLVHFHANNCTTFGPEDMSIVVEITLMSRSLLDNGEELLIHELPISGLDAKNIPDAPDVLVRFDSDN